MRMRTQEWLVPHQSGQPLAPAAAGNDTPPPFISIHDLFVILGLPFLTALSWFGNEASWSKALTVAGACAQSMLHHDMPVMERRIAEAVGRRHFPMPPDEIARAVVAYEVEVALQVLREHSPAGWRPTIEIAGAQRLADAERKGRGAILWDSRMAFTSLVTKRGIHHAGYRLHHLSRPEHGFSGTRFGMRFLNWLRTGAECRYLAERIVIDHRDRGTALHALAARLSANRLVSIAVTGVAHRPVRVPMFDGGLDIAPGAPVLALRTGATLIPVFTLRLGVGRFCIVVGDALEPSPLHSPESAVHEMAAAYVRQLEPFVLSYPDQWMGWADIRTQGAGMHPSPALERADSDFHPENIPALDK